MVDVYLSDDELVEIELNQDIEVVGMTTDEIIETSWTGEFTYVFEHYQMPIAYLVNDTEQ